MASGSRSGRPSVAAGCGLTLAILGAVLVGLWFFAGYLVERKQEAEKARVAAMAPLEREAYFARKEQEQAAKREADRAEQEADRVATLRSGAKWACRNFVQQRLKAPATAKFQNYNDYTIVDLPPADAAYPSYLVNGYVDAENSFGAKLRTSFVCTVKAAPNESWQLLKVTTD